MLTRPSHDVFLINVLKRKTFLLQTFTFDVSASFDIAFDVALKDDDAQSRMSIAVDNLTTQVEVKADASNAADVTTFRVRQSGKSEN